MRSPIDCVKFLSFMVLFITVITFCSITSANDRNQYIFADISGELFINGSSRWTKETLEGEGFKILEINKKKANSGLYRVSRGENKRFDLEIHKGIIYRVIIMDYGIPINTGNDKVQQIRVGDNISTILKLSSSYEKLYGEDIGMYFLLNGASFHTLCTDSPLEMDADRKQRMPMNYDLCKIDKIILISAQERSWSTK